MVQILDKAVKLWEDENEVKLLISEWNSDPYKISHEEFIASLVHSANTIVDLGCGSGRLLDYLYLNLGDIDYVGYDNSPLMIVHAIDAHPGDAHKFSCVDIYRFQSSVELYDVVIAQDVIQHSDNPIDAVHIICNNWRAKKYFISMIVGPDHEELYNSSVISFEEFFRLDATLDATSSYFEKCVDEKFYWVLLGIGHAI